MTLDTHKYISFVLCEAQNRTTEEIEKCTCKCGLIYVRKPPIVANPLYERYEQIVMYDITVMKDINKL